MNKPIGLRSGKLTEINAIGLCDISLFMASWYDNQLVNGQDLLFDNNGIPLGNSAGMMPYECKAEYNNGLNGPDDLFLFGLEGEMLT